MKDKEQKIKAKEFAEFWKGKGYEKGQSQVFWYSLLNEVLGVENPKEFIEFEDQVHIDKNTGFIDGYIPSTKILIEQKSIDKDLRKGIRQSDGSLLTPFQQAKKYIAELPVSKHPKWVITCNFKSFLIYNMENPNGEPEEILLENLEKECYRLQFIVDTGNENVKKEMQISIDAGKIVGEIYDKILPLYKNPSNVDTLKSLNALCVRLVFCLYAEDAGIFGKRRMFHDYLSRFEPIDLRRALIDLFKVLDTKVEDRDEYMTEDLKQIPYVNGGLFADENIEIPILTEEVKNIILAKASEDFDWNDISPTIFGAVFESTLNPETRRSGGMHYTSIENIHKVIDPLFLDELKQELSEIKNISVLKTRNNKIREFQDKISNLTFLDPACGSGNFLTQTYISLRKLENEALTILTQGQMSFGDTNIVPIKVSIGQFYGIEINDFAVTVAKTALWIAESQMMKETEKIIHKNLEFLPLKSYANIIEANALRIDWNEVIDKNKLNYIMGNPPFVANTARVSAKESHSQKMLSDSQAKDRDMLFGKNGGLLDYVACWYKKATMYMKDTNICCAFVSTDSITQGQQVEPLWEELFKSGIKIYFAHSSFKWSNDTNEKGATVYVVIIGFSFLQHACKIYSGDTMKKVSYINAYLLDAPNVIVTSRAKTLCNVPDMQSGGKPVEGGYLIFSEDEKREFVKKEPLSEKYFHKFTSGETFINGKMKWCLWLVDANPKELNSMPMVRDRIKLVREFRLNSKKEATRKGADIPHLFMEIKQPKNKYLVIPLTTSRNRRYVPMGFLSSDVIANNGTSFIPNATLFHFGILTSNTHMAWMRAICGYFGPSYRYSNKIVYNNFPWPNPTDNQKEKIEKTAQAIINARALYPESSLADLYDELTMPKELRKAHQENDKAVMEAYGFNWRTMSESDCVAELMKMYQELTKI